MTLESESQLYSMASNWTCIGTFGAVGNLRVLAFHSLSHRILFAAYHAEECLGGLWVAIESLVPTVPTLKLTVQENLGRPKGRK